MSTLPHVHIRSALAWIGELVYLVDLLLVTMLLALVVIAGINPVDSPVVVVALVVGIGIVLAHRVWYVRHRQEIEHDQGHLRARERRGF